MSASMRAWNACSSGVNSATSLSFVTPVSTICAYIGISFRCVHLPSGHWRKRSTIRYTFPMRQAKTVSQSAGHHTDEIDAPNPFVARWTRRTLASDPPRARSLIVTVWGDALAPHGGVVWLSGLIRLMASFGMSERLVRTSVFRLVRDGWLKGQTVGRRSRYRLTREGARRFEAAHHRIYAMPAPQWDGDWAIVVASPHAAPNHTRTQLRDELAWEGFGTLASGVYLKPLHGDSALPKIVAALGLASRVAIVRARDDSKLGGRALAASVDRAWNIAALT